MKLYENHVLPHLINYACGLPAIEKQRKKVVPMAEGRVLEIGMGSGLNLKFYDREKVEFVWGLEPSKGMRRKAGKNLEASPVEVRWLDLPGEEVPLDDKSADTVMLTYSLCTIEGWLKALGEMRRVLKPGGKLIFCEHGEAPDADVRKWQERINPVWKKIAGGCDLNRKIPRCIEEGGFRIRDMESDYVDSPRFASFEYWGVAD
ncbi:MAG: class I SAM-dependent methyltransferase [Acidobacteriota bacterium]|nr:MAG: class I SAM-dependent methyltransferase [Acidobacteriota bacterium]